MIKGNLILKAARKPAETHEAWKQQCAGEIKKGKLWPSKQWVKDAADDPMHPEVKDILNQAFASKIAFDCHPGHAAWRSWGELGGRARSQEASIPCGTSVHNSQEVDEPKWPASPVEMEDADLEATANFVWNEEGEEDPSAMGVKVAFKQGTEKQEVN